MAKKPKKNKAKQKKYQPALKFKLKRAVKAKKKYFTSHQKARFKKAGRKKAKAMLEHIVVKPTEEQIKNLIIKGRSRGFITETELLFIFPEVEEYVYDYELTLEELQKNGIQIIEDTGGFLGLD